MGYRILYHPKVEDDDIPALPGTVIQRVKKAIDERLLTRPDMYGKSLRKGLSGYRKLRIGDWRIIYRIDDNEVKIIMIAHRSKVYGLVFDRMPSV
ncbi:MAG: type II toxin-antitoxin system RelE/ParE family toxin [Candidatus Uhrbacteria bacterium]|nr:type II toxin-antitoxin system RelE/ParE family toxin [Candidatus Uhrbacteria bacterium]